MSQRCQLTIVYCGGTDECYYHWLSCVPIQEEGAVHVWGNRGGGYSTVGAAAVSALLLGGLLLLHLERGPLYRKGVETYMWGFLSNK